MREGARAPLLEHSDTTVLYLRRLSDEIVRWIINKVAASLPDDVVEGIVKRADGIPLFAIELAQLMSIHRAAASDRRIPASLADILSARLDQLGPAKFVAQVVAVIGDQRR